MPKDIKILDLKNGILVPGLSRTTTFLSGPASLVQRVVKCLFTIQGSDIMNPEFGVGLQSVLPKNYNPNDFGKVKLSVTEAIIRAEKMLKEDDALVSAPPEERLQSLSFKDIVFNANESEWVVDMSVRTVANTLYSFKVGSK